MRIFFYAVIFGLVAYWFIFQLMMGTMKLNQTP
jgi:hypothetical protein